MLNAKKMQPNRCRLRHGNYFVLTANKKSPAPYSIVPLQTPYELPFSQNTSVTDRRQTDDRRQLCHKCAIQHTCSCSMSKPTV